MQRIPRIRVKEFPKTDELIYHKTISAKTIVRVHEEKGSTREYAIVEAVLSGDRGEIVICLHPDIQYVVENKTVRIKTDPKDFTDNFKALVDRFQIAWVTENTYLDHLYGFKNHNLKPGAKNPS